MKNLKSIYFFPSTGRASLYLTEDGFSGSAPQELESLPTELQSAVASAVGWMQAQPEMVGVFSVEQIVLEPSASAVTAYDESGSPSAWERRLSAAVTGGGEKGSKQATFSDAPPEILQGLLAVWDALESNLNS